jgi:Nif-specific regulatory protein
MSDIAGQLDDLRKEFSRLQTAFGSADLRFGVVRQLFAILNTTFDEEEILAKALGIIESAVGVEAGSMLLFDPTDGKLYFSAATGPKAEEVKEFRIDPGLGVSGWCFQQNEPVAVSDVASDPRFYRQISKSLGFETRCLLCAPIRVAGEAVGVLELVNKRDGNEFHTDEAELVSMVGILVGQLIDNARRFHESK